MHVDPAMRQSLLPLKRKIVKLFNENHWLELGTLTDSYHIVSGHYRLLRSLSFGDDDYEGNVLAVLNSIIALDPTNLSIISDYVNELEGGGTYSPAIQQMGRASISSQRYSSYKISLKNRTLYR